MSKRNPKPRVKTEARTKAGYERAVISPEAFSAVGREVLVDNHGKGKTMEKYLLDLNSGIILPAIILAIIAVAGTIAFTICAKAGSLGMLSVLSVVVIALVLFFAFYICHFSSKKIRILLYNISMPIKQIVETNTSLACGQLGNVFEYGDDDEFNDIMNTIRVMDATLQALLKEVSGVFKNVSDGNLSYRADSSKFKGAYKELVDGINNTVSALQSPITTTASYLKRISEGDIPEAVEEEAHGDFAEIKDSLNVCISAINRLLTDAEQLTEAAAYGKLRQRADASAHDGKFGELMDGINTMMDTLVSHLDHLPSPVTIVSPTYTLQFANLAAAELVGSKHEDIEGKRKCYEMMNSTVCRSKECVCANAMRSKAAYSGDAMATPPNNGEAVSQPIDINHTGIPLYNKAGKVVGALELIRDESEITGAMRNAEAEKERATHEAAYQMQEVSDLVERLGKIADGDFDVEFSIHEPDEITAKTAAEFRKINDSMKACLVSIKGLTGATRELADAALAGDLSKRADVSKHKGEYAKVVEGINKTLNSVLGPIDSANEVLQEIANGNLSKKVEGDFHGDQAIIKDNMNTTVDRLRGIISEISTVLAAIGNGDLTVSIGEDYPGDFAEIRNALVNIISKLSNVMSGLNNAAEQVASGSKQLSEASQTLANGSTQQAQAIQQLTASVTQIADQIKQNAVDANEASSLSFHAKESAEAGNIQMQDMLSAMADINESSTSISKIIKVIDDIAFQTNILALNAAVEAARAGVHGKGFAVVAEEVRNLAAKSAEAASETTALIESSMNKVEGGTKIANATAAAFEEILSEVGNAASIVERIADASNSQATDIAQINNGINQISDVVQSNSATSEQSAASSQELYSQADMLKHTVATFKIDKNGVGKSTKSFSAEPIMPPEDMTFLEMSDMSDKY